MAFKVIERASVEVSPWCCWFWTNQMSHTQVAKTTSSFPKCREIKNMISLKLRAGYLDHFDPRGICSQTCLANAQLNIACLSSSSQYPQWTQWILLCKLFLCRFLPEKRIFKHPSKWRGGISAGSRGYRCNSKAWILDVC